MSQWWGEKWSVFRGSFKPESDFIWSNIALNRSFCDFRCLESEFWKRSYFGRFWSIKVKKTAKYQKSMLKIQGDGVQTNMGRRETEGSQLDYAPVHDRVVCFIYYELHIDYLCLGFYSNNHHLQGTELHRCVTEATVALSLPVGTTASETSLRNTMTVRHSPFVSDCYIFLYTYWCRVVNVIFAEVRRPVPQNGSYVCLPWSRSRWCPCTWAEC